MKNLLLVLALFSASAQASFLIPDGGVTTAKIASSAVTNAKMAANSVTTTNIADANVTYAKTSATNSGESVSCGVFSTSSNTLVDVTNLSVTITTSGHPVVVGLISDSTGGSGNYASVGLGITAATGATRIDIFRDVSDIASFNLTLTIPGATSGHMDNAPGSVIAFDSPSAGSHTYKVQTAVQTAASSLIQYCRLYAYELK